MIEIKKDDEYIIEVSKLMFTNCITIPSSLHECFDFRFIDNAKFGEKIGLEFHGKRYIGNVNPKHSTYQVTLPPAIRSELARTFKSSCVFCTLTKPGNVPDGVLKEKLKMKLEVNKDKYTIFLEEAYVLKSVFDEAFENLIARGELILEPPQNQTSDNSEELLLFSSRWLKPSDLAVHAGKQNTIYTLRNDTTRIQYIGKADVLGGRLKCVGQNEEYIGHKDDSEEYIEKEGWTSWRYDKVNVKDDKSLRQVESLLIDHAHHCGVRLSNISHSRHFKNAVEKEDTIF